MIRRDGGIGSHNRCVQLAFCGYRNTLFLVYQKSKGDFLQRESAKRDMSLVLVGNSKPGGRRKKKIESFLAPIRKAQAKTSSGYKALGNGQSHHPPTGTTEGGRRIVKR
jgi:hypothetical protein